MLSNYSNNTEPSLQEFEVITGHINSTYVPEICATLEPFYLHSQQLSDQNGEV